MGLFLLKRFAELIRVRYLQIVSRKYSNTLLLISLQKQKLVQSKALQQKLLVLILEF